MEGIHCTPELNGYAAPVLTAWLKPVKTWF